MTYRIDEVASFTAIAAEIRTKEYFATVLPQLQAEGLAEPEAVEVVENGRVE